MGMEKLTFLPDFVTDISMALTRTHVFNAGNIIVTWWLLPAARRTLLFRPPREEMTSVHRVDLPDMRFMVVERKRGLFWPKKCVLGVCGYAAVDDDAVGWRSAGATGHVPPAHITRPTNDFCPRCTCLGKTAARRVRAGKLDPVDAWLSTAWRCSHNSLRAFFDTSRSEFSVMSIDELTHIAIMEARLGRITLSD